MKKIMLLLLCCCTIKIMYSMSGKLIELDQNISYNSRIDMDSADEIIIQIKEFILKQDEAKINDLIEQNTLILQKSAPEQIDSLTDFASSLKNIAINEKVKKRKSAIPLFVSSGICTAYTILYCISQFKSWQAENHLPYECYNYMNDDWIGANRGFFPVVNLATWISLSLGFFGLGCREFMGNEKKATELAQLVSDFSESYNEEENKEGS